MRIGKRLDQKFDGIVRPERLCESLGQKIGALAGEAGGDVEKERLVPRRVGSRQLLEFAVEMVRPVSHDRDRHGHARMQEA